MSRRTAGPLLAALLAWSLLLAGCASLTEPLDPPNVSLESLRSLPAEGGGPRFEIKLRVQNPNEQPLDIVGISYAIALAGQEVITGYLGKPVLSSYSPLEIE